MSTNLQFPDPQLFDECLTRSKKSTWRSSYNGLEIRADSRIHEFVSWYTSEFFSINNTSNICCTDLAAGSGACISRLSDATNHNILFSCNDFESQLSFSSPNIKEKFCLDLNFHHDLPEATIVLAIEVIEHLENPRALIKTISSSLSNDGFAILSTPNTNSFLDRHMFIRHGHEYYFGHRGYVNSGGHMFPQPRWLLQKFFNEEGLHWQHYGLPFWESVGMYAKAKCIIPWLMSIGSNRIGINDSINLWILTKPS